jgi:hypothetical protein
MIARVPRLKPGREQRERTFDVAPVSLANRRAADAGAAEFNILYGVGSKRMS